MEQRLVILEVAFVFSHLRLVFDHLVHSWVTGITKKINEIRRGKSRKNKNTNENLMMSRLI